MTDGPSLPLLTQQQDRSEEPLTLGQARARFAQWICEHPAIAAQVGEEIGLTIYLSGGGDGITLAMQQIRMAPISRIPVSQDFGMVED